MGCMCGFTTTVVTSLLFVTNLLFLLSGIALVVVGIKTSERLTTFEALFHGTFSATAIAIIVVGSIVFVIGFVGCCGAIQKSVFLLQVYCVLLMLVFLAEVIIGVVALTKVDDAEDFVNERLDDFFTVEYQDDGESELFDIIQNKLKCCGVNGTIDYYTLGVGIPTSCCPDKEVAICKPLMAYQQGCRDEFTDYVIDSVRIIGITALSVAACEVFAAMFACCLAVRFKDKKRQALSKA